MNERENAREYMRECMNKLLGEQRKHMEQLADDARASAALLARDLTRRVEQLERRGLWRRIGRAVRGRQ